MQKRKTINGKALLCLFLVALFLISTVVTLPASAATPVVGREDGADFLSFQTTKPDADNRFNLRLIAGTNSLDYRNFGYQIILITLDSNGKPVTNELRGTDHKAYTSVYGGGRYYSIKDTYNYDYACIATVTGLDAACTYLELIVRPYITEKDGTRKYGEGAQLCYTGARDAAGFPTFVSTEATEADSLWLMPSDDSYIKLDAGESPNGSESTVKLKTNINADGSYGNNTRYVYMKFELTDEYKETFLTSGKQVYLVINVAAAYQNNGTFNKIDVYRTNTGWTEGTLTAANKPATFGSLAGQIALNGSGTYQIDITSALAAQISSGASAISFRLSNTLDDGGNTNLIYTKESSSFNAPHFTSVNNAIFPYDLNFDKRDNSGYEPWAYAEQLVAEWINTEKNAIYSNEQTDVFNVGNMQGTTKKSIASVNGTHTIAIAGSGSGNPPTPAFKTYYARTLDTLSSAGGYVKATGAAVTTYDSYGGISNAGFTGSATGYFHTEVQEGRTYIIDPLGNPFIVCGVNTINNGSTGNQQSKASTKFGSNYWSSITTQLRSFGINASTGDTSATTTSNYLNGIVSISGISSYMKSLNLSTSTGGSTSFANGNTMNVFDPDFVTWTDAKNQVTLAAYKNNPKVLGYTSDNELPLDKDMLDRYLNLDTTDPVNAFSYATAWTWLAAKQETVLPDKNRITDALREEFKAFVFGRLFKTVSGQIEKYDGNHMYIGTRANGANKTSEGYLRAAGKYCEVLTINMYDGLEPSGDTIATIYRYSGRPFIVTEFYSKAQESYDLNGQLLANQQNAGWLVKTQNDRAVYYQNYTLLLLESKYCVGWVWFRFQDNDQSLYKITTSDGKTFTNLRVWEKGSGYAIKSFIVSGAKNGAASELITLTSNSAVNVSSGKNSTAAGVSMTYYDGGTPKTVTGTITVTYKGETDTSGLGSNKGLLDSNFNFYARSDTSSPLQVCDAIKLVGDNLVSLIHYFDNLHAN